MNEQEKKDLLEHRKWIEEIEHMLESRSHWKERAKSQDNHRDALQKQMQLQKWVWIFTVLLGILAISANVYIKTNVEKTQNMPEIKTEIEKIKIG